MGIIEILYAPIRRERHMTFEDLLDILAEQFSCDAAELSEDKIGRASCRERV